ncbi:hypothetical protein BKA93DRAFT_778345 [Sparassis latifolia]
MFLDATVTLADHIATLRDIARDIRLRRLASVESLWYEYWDTALNFCALSMARSCQRFTVSPQRALSRDVLRPSVELPSDYVNWSTDVNPDDLVNLADNPPGGDEETRREALMKGASARIAQASKDIYTETRFPDFVVLFVKGRGQRVGIRSRVRRSLVCLQSSYHSSEVRL